MDILFRKHTNKNNYFNYYYHYALNYSQYFQLRNQHRQYRIINKTKTKLTTEVVKESSKSVQQSSEW